MQTFISTLSNRINANASVRNLQIVSLGFEHANKGLPRASRAQLASIMGGFINQGMYMAYMKAYNSSVAGINRGKV